MQNTQPSTDLMTSPSSYSQEFQDTYTRIYRLAENLRLYLKEYREGSKSEGHETTSLEGVQQLIDSAIQGLTEQRYDVAVVAPMSAGKSTFLNAIIGAEVLANENCACTVARTEIKHIQPGVKPSLIKHFLMSDGTKASQVLFQEEDATKFREKFLAETHAERENIKRSNPTQGLRFEVNWPIEAIQDMPSLSGFTLIDTPGPNEWYSNLKNLNDIATLKQVSLDALRTCKAVLFVLDYSSLEDEANMILFQSITESRQTFLEQDRDRIFFVVNKKDLRNGDDPEISVTIAKLKEELIRFGFANPNIVAVSSLQGLLAKLIQQGRATEKHENLFGNKFSSIYSRRNKDGSGILLTYKETAPLALADSNILEAQQIIFHTIIQTSGWFLLSDALETLDKAGKAFEDTLKTQIAGWEMELSTLKSKADEYRQKSELSSEKLQVVREKIDETKMNLLTQFRTGVDQFTEISKIKLEEQINDFAKSLNSSSNSENALTNTELNYSIDNTSDESPKNILSPLVDLPVVGPVFRVAVPLIDFFGNIFSSNTPSGINPETMKRGVNEPYIIRCATSEEAKAINKVINSFCAPNIELWWAETQDVFIREGTAIREKLLADIKADVQLISDELSTYLGDELKLDVNINPIQFPSYSFQNIDNQVQKIQGQYTKRRRKRWYREPDSYILDLREISKNLKKCLDDDATASKKVISDVIKTQIDEDFKYAQDQLEGYIQKFNDDFAILIAERDRNAEIAPSIVESLKKGMNGLEAHLNEIKAIRIRLQAWKHS